MYIIESKLLTWVAELELLQLSYVYDSASSSFHQVIKQVWREKTVLSVVFTEG